MMSNGSDINVSSIEEDIEILNSIVKVNKDFLSDIENQTINQKEIKALEHLLSDYTRQKQINEEHRKENGLLREKVKKLEEENIQKDLEIIGIEECTKENMKEIIEQYYTANEDCISKKKIKDKIEEYKELVDEFEKTDNTGRFKRTNSIDYYKLEALQELLQESEE